MSYLNKMVLCQVLFHVSKCIFSMYWGREEEEEGEREETEGGRKWREMEGERERGGGD